MLSEKKGSLFSVFNNFVKKNLPLKENFCILILYSLQVTENWVFRWQISPETEGKLLSEDTKEPECIVCKLYSFCITDHF